MTYAGDLTPRQAWDLLESEPGAVLVDVRTRAEWTFVGVPDTADLGRDVLLSEWVSYPGGVRNADFLAPILAAGLAPGDARPIVFICRSGVRSIAAAKAATAAGLGPAYNVLDGFEGNLDASGRRGASGWRAEGLPWRQT